MSGKATPTFNTSIEREAWNWCWPNPGPTPVNQSMDSEIFDSIDVQLSETVVREAIQNSLDARTAIDNQAVTVKIEFHEEKNGPQIAFLKKAMAYRQESGMAIPADWTEGNVRWMTIEDFDATGLQGSVNKRTDDFWNYWLNFGLSNKAGKSRGGRGIGRVTFLIASMVTTVLGYTRRADQFEYACGMTVLRAGEYGSEFRSTHAYLAKQERDSVYELHNSSDFLKSFKESFHIRSEVEATDDCGLSIVIPYPEESLHTNGILASVVENFGPAVLQGILEVLVGGESLNASTLPTIAKKCSVNFHVPAIKEDPNRFIRLLNAIVDSNGKRIKLPLEAARKEEICKLSEIKVVREAIDFLEEGEVVAMDIEFPLQYEKKSTRVVISSIVMQTPHKLTSVDMFFRDGMYLPSVRSRSTRGYDVIFIVSDESLSDYLNLCEGKAHLDLLESQEVKAKLKEKGCRVLEKRFVKSLPESLRLLLVPEITEPDATVFSDIFSMPQDGTASRTSRNKRSNPNNNPQGQYEIKKRLSPFVLSEKPRGFRVTANPDFKGWPVALKLTIAYADGTRKPKWTRYDFEVNELAIKHVDCKLLKVKDNGISAIDCYENFSIDVLGFDDNREVDIRIHQAKNPVTEGHA